MASSRLFAGMPTSCQPWMTSTGQRIRPTKWRGDDGASHVRSRSDILFA